MREVKPKCKQNRADQGGTQQLARDLSQPPRRGRAFVIPVLGTLAILEALQRFKNTSETTQSRDVDNLQGVASVGDMKLCH